MEILIKPRIFTGQSYWYNKMNSVILVEKQEDIEPLWELLCEQDDYWEVYKHCIKVAPKEIESESEISILCEYCGNADIDDIEGLRKIIPFIIYQEVYE